MERLPLAELVVPRLGAHLFGVQERSGPQAGTAFCGELDVEYLPAVEHSFTAWEAATDRIDLADLYRNRWGRRLTADGCDAGNSPQGRYQVPAEVFCL
jgi:hypothetical protein